MEVYTATIGGRPVVLSGSVVHNEPEGPLELHMLGGVFEITFSRGTETLNNVNVVGPRRVHIELVNYDNYGGTSFIVERVPYEAGTVTIRFCVHSLSANGTRLITFTAA